MYLNQYPQTNQTRNSYGADLLPNQMHLVFMNTPTNWARVRVRVRVRLGSGTGLGLVSPEMIKELAARNLHVLHGLALCEG